MSDVSEAARQLGRKGGKAKTAAKQAASRENGKLGGRPKMRKHTHQKVNGKEKDYGFMGCVNHERQNEAAHGNITRIDVCRCGATRKTNINGIHHERGVWEE